MIPRPRFIVAFGIAAWLLTSADGRVPLRDLCAREAVEDWPFIRWRHPPVDRPLTLEEDSVRRFLEYCRRNPENAAQWSRVRRAAG